MGAVGREARHPYCPYPLVQPSHFSPAVFLVNSHLNSSVNMQLHRPQTTWTSQWTLRDKVHPRYISAHRKHCWLRNSWLIALQPQAICHHAPQPMQVILIVLSHSVFVILEIGVTTIGLLLICDTSSVIWLKVVIRGVHCSSFCSL